MPFQTSLVRKTPALQSVKSVTLMSELLNRCCNSKLYEEITDPKNPFNATKFESLISKILLRNYSQINLVNNIAKSENIENTIVSLLQNVILDKSSFEWAINVFLKDSNKIDFNTIHNIYEIDSSEIKYTENASENYIFQTHQWVNHLLKIYFEYKNMFITKDYDTKLLYTGVLNVLKEENKEIEYSLETAKEHEGVGFIFLGDPEKSDFTIQNILSLKGKKIEQSQNEYYRKFYYNKLNTSFFISSKLVLEHLNEIETVSSPLQALFQWPQSTEVSAFLEKIQKNTSKKFNNIEIKENDEDETISWLKIHFENKEKVKQTLKVKNNREMLFSLNNRLSQHRPGQEFVLAHLKMHPGWYDRSQIKRLILKVLSDKIAIEESINSYLTKDNKIDFSSSTAILEKDITESELIKEGLTQTTLNTLNNVRFLFELYKEKFINKNNNSQEDELNNNKRKFSFDLNQTLKKYKLTTFGTVLNQDIESNDNNDLNQNNTPNITELNYGNESNNEINLNDNSDLNKTPPNQITSYELKI